ncbi:MAG: Txe/YoeB family addiction module toxin [Nitrospirae bacterium]|nr:Txe/YoeB family addiction module toxin [Nitrospirota bacterium]
MRKVVFEFSAFENFNEWSRTDIKIYKKIVQLITDINRNPFSGIGKPEALKYELNGYWSRRINEEHRLVYSVTEEQIYILSCRYHY